MSEIQKDQPVKLARTCDGLEQEAFEAWAEDHHLPMDCHPLHYIFLDPRTDAARNAWKGGLQYASKIALEAMTVMAAENKALREALHEAIDRPKGVVPASAETFYNPSHYTR